MGSKLRGVYPNEEEEWSAKDLHKKVASMIRSNLGAAIDLGSGSGNLGKMLSEKGYEVTCLDYSNFLKHGLRFKKADLDKRFPLKGEFADVVTAVEIIEHLENPRHFLGEIQRVLRSGGIAILTTPNILHWKARLYYLLKGIIWGFREEDYRISGHITPVTIHDFKRICAEVGLKILEITYSNSNMGLFGETLIVVVSKR